MNRDEYDNIEAWNPSLIKIGISKSMKAMRYEMLNRRDPSTVMALGIACHVRILEGPEAFADRYAIGGPINPRTGEPYGNLTKAYAEWEAEQNKPVLTLATAEAVEEIAEAVEAHPVAARLLAEPRNTEMTVLWQDQDEPCKGRIDAYTESGILLDLKTTTDPYPVAFQRSLVKYGHHISLAAYKRGLLKNCKTVRDILVIAVQAVAPYEVVVYRVAPETIAVGEQEWIRGVQMAANCKKTGVWPGYSNDIEPIDLPDWAVPESEVEY